MTRLRYGLILALCFVSGTAQARQEIPQNDLSGTAFFERFDETNLLPDGTARKIIQDKFGQMWIATQKGLVRYDGLSFEHYMPRHDADSPPVRNISGVEEAPDGSIWFGAIFGGGVARFDQATQRIQTFRLPTVPEAPDSYTVNSTLGLHIDPAGRAWVIGRGQDRADVAFRIDSKSGEVTHVETDLSDSTKLSAGIQSLGAKSVMLNLSEGSMLVATRDGGLHRYLPETETVERLYLPTDSTDGPAFIDLFERRNGEIWASRVQTEEGGVRFGFTVTSGFTVTDVCRLDMDPFSMSCHAIVIDGKKQAAFALVETLDGVLMAMAGTGFCQWSDELGSLTCTKVSEETGFAHFPTAQVDKSGNIWTNVLGPGELAVLNPRTREYRPVQVSAGPDDENPANDISHLMIDRKGTLWAGGFWSGLNRLNKGRAQFELLTDAEHSSLRLPDSQPTDALFANEDGSIWIPTRRGALRYHPDRGVTGRVGGTSPVRNIVQRRNGAVLYTQGDSLISAPASLTGSRFVGRIPGTMPIFDVFEDSREVLWIGHDEGLIKTDAMLRNPVAVPVMVTPRAAVSDSISQREVFTIREDSQGYVWFSTDEGGLDRYDPESGQFRSFFNPAVSTGSGKPVEIGDGVFWFEGSSSVVELDTKSGEMTSFGPESGFPPTGVGHMIMDAGGDVWIRSYQGLYRVQVQSGKVTKYDQASGLPVSRIGGPALTGDGAVWWRAVGGVLTYHPDRMQSEEYAPDVVIRSVSHADSTDILLGRDAISLAHWDNDLSFTYFAVDFDSPDRNRYRYRMVGLDDEWVDVAGLTSIRLSNVPPGRYTFEVQAANADGIWSETPASVVVRITPPWWRSVWAYMIYIVLAGMMVRQFVAWNTSRVQRMERETQQARELEQARELARAHAELEASHTTLKSTQAQLIEQEKLASLGSLTAGIAHEIKNPLNFVNNFAEVGGELADELSEAIASGNAAEAHSIVEELKANALQITKHGRRADDIVKAMMQHARGGAAERETVDVNAFVAEYIDLAWHGMRAKDHTFDCQVERALTPDAGSAVLQTQDMGRVLLNLLNNAFYATQMEGGSPDARVRVATSREDDRIVITVADNGPGIPEAIRPKIFEPFFTTKPTGEGTGLGLSLSHDIVTKGHGGSMTVGTSADGGALFTISLPAGT